MREIKFRAWDNKDKKWLMGYEMPNIGGFSMFGECMLLEEWSRHLDRFILQQEDRKPEDLILMQYTGLKDKNGKEVYDGDIIDLKDQWWDASGQAGYNSPIVLVEWKKNFSGFFPFSNYDCDCGVYYDADLSEILGNIYENPELLNSEVEDEKY